MFLARNPPGDNIIELVHYFDPAHLSFYLQYYQTCSLVFWLDPTERIFLSVGGGGILCRWFCERWDNETVQRDLFTLFVQCYSLPSSNNHSSVWLCANWLLTQFPSSYMSLYLSNIYPGIPFNFASLHLPDICLRDRHQMPTVNQDFSPNLASFISWHKFELPLSTLSSLATSLIKHCVFK